ncbi:MAG: lipid-A-disaccharide synthase-related protein [Pleurocapsa sp.]
MKLLVLSNGHGEDIIAVRIVEQLQKSDRKLEIAALPIVGEGYIYTKNQIPIIGRVQQMPSGGFIYMESDRLWQDVRGGLIPLTIEQIKLVRHWGQTGGVILAVGDIVPLLYAWLSGSNYAFVGTAKSEYYLKDDGNLLPGISTIERFFGSAYFPWERWLLSRDRCKAVFPRDDFTAETLQKWSIPAYNLGNPMMDGIGSNLEDKTPQTSSIKKLSILLLPGSRMPEALDNWEKIINAVSGVIQAFREYQLEFIAAIAPALNSVAFQEYLFSQNWKLIDFLSFMPVNDKRSIGFTKDGVTLWLSQNAYSECLQKSQIAIAMAGTATEQFVGLGKPVVTIPGEGPQFTLTFAQAQTRLLGCSVTLVQNPQQVGRAMVSILNNLEKLSKIKQNGQKRLGDSGAAKRIALCLQKTLLVD